MTEVCYEELTDLEKQEVDATIDIIRAVRKIDTFDYRILRQDDGTITVDVLFNGHQKEYYSSTS